MALSKQAIYGCCGIHVIAGFPHIADQCPSATHKEVLAKVEAEFKVLFATSKNFVIVCSLIETQLLAESILRKYGFRQVSSTLKNPNTSNRLVMFLYDKKTLKEIKESRFKKRVA